MSEPTQTSPARVLFQAHGWKIFPGGLVIIGLYLTSRYSYVLFHSLVELFSIAIGWVLFLIIWNARKWVDTRYLLVLGTALAAAGGLDLVHTLAYKGMNLFPGFDSNLPTQLWIAARYLQSLSMLGALWFATAIDQSWPISGSGLRKSGRSFEAGVLVVYATSMGGLLLLIFLRQFPVCYIEGQGLTPFKIISEYVISFILLISLAGLWLRRRYFDRTLIYLLIAATGFTIVSELAFTFYVGVYDFSNLVGHYGKLAAFFLLYLAVVESGLQRPYSTLFRNLSQKTIDLQKSEAQYRLLVENANDMVYSTTPAGIFQYLSPAWTRLMGYAIPELINQPFQSFIHPSDLPGCAALFEETIRSGKGRSDLEYRVRHKDGSWRWHTANTSVIKDTENQVVSYIGIARDISERKLAEEALHENEAKFRALFHNVPMSGVIYWLIRNDQNEIVDWELQDINTRGAADLQQSPADLIGKRASALFGAEVMQPYLDLCREVVATNQPRHIETYFAHNDKYYLSAVFCLGTDFYANVSVDITERKRMEEALRESEAHFRGYFEQGIVGMAITTPDKGWGLVNQTLCDQLGYTQEELAHMTWAELTHPDDLEADAALFNRMLAGELDAYRLEKRFLRKDGQIIQVDMGVHYQRKPDGQVDYCLALFSNITERKEAEQERDQLLSETQRNAAELDAVFNALPYLVSLHAKDGRYLKVNPKIIETFGFDPIEASREEIAQRLKAHFPDGQALTPDNMPSKRALAGEAVYGVEYIITDAEGHERTLLYNAIPWKVGGEMQGAVFAQEDITERKRAEAKIQADQVELQGLLAEAKHTRRALLNVIEDQKEVEERVRRLNAELEQRVQERTAELWTANQELEAFSYSVSHDLRGPLRSLDGFSQFLLEDYSGQLDEQGKNYLTRIQIAARHMGQLINDLLNLSRVTRAELARQQIDLSGLANGIAADLKAQFPERRAEFVIAANMTAEGDGNLLRIVLENLLNNAWKFSGQRELTLIAVGKEEQAGKWVYFVRDNGAGFDMAYANKLFGAFQRLHSEKEFPGTGIGLATVQRIIQRHGGRVWAEGSVDQGATFYFTIS